MSQLERIGSHKTSIFTDNGFTHVKYHYTSVVKFNQDSIVLNSNGYRTQTTKARMNQASSQYALGFRVYQQDYNWYIEYQGYTLEFYDNITLDRHEERFIRCLHCCEGQLTSSDNCPDCGQSLID